MKMYKWYFKGFDIKFISSEETFDRHVAAQRETLQTKNKVVIENEYTSDDPITTADCASCNGNAKSAKITTLPVYTEVDETPADPSLGLQHLSADVDSTNSASSDLGDEPDLSLLGGSSNGNPVL